MQFFSSRYNAQKAVSVLKSGVIWLAVLFCYSTAMSQASSQPSSQSSSFAPPDSEFVMQVSRINNEVLITLTFSDSAVFEYADIERRAEFSSEFSRCKYIPYGELKTKGRHLVKKDQYAYSSSSDVLYRLKIVTTDGAERIFPPVDLPAVKK